MNPDEPERSNFVRERRASARRSPALTAFVLLVVLLLNACASSGGSAPAKEISPTAPATVFPPAASATPVLADGLVLAQTQVATAGATTPSAPTTTPSTPVDTPTAVQLQPVSVQIFPDPSGYEWRLVVQGIRRPTAIVSPHDGSGRMFVLEQGGRILVMHGGNVLLADPFLDITSRVGSQQSEQGLLGLDFSPTYVQDGFFYVNYTDRLGNTVVSRLKVTQNPDVADPNSEQVLLTVDQPYPNHNGGGVVFGPDGYLYLSLGDGGSAGDPSGNGQSLDTVLGKILRIDVSKAGAYGAAYAIPPDNPFANGGGRPEIWAYGLRNPWRFSFDRVTKDLWIADVGQNLYEETDYQPAGSPGGLNYGWNYMEGAHPYKGTPPNGIALVGPVFEYDHSQGCSVTGGYVYRGQELPEFNGVYLFGDYCSGIIWGVLNVGGSWQTQKLFQTGMNITSFGQDENGELYLLNQADGSVHRLLKKP
jgi:glucose/arabinose dehydrogenase